MSYSFREGHATVIHIDATVIRAVTGVQELFTKPSLELKACYAVPRASSSRAVTRAPSPAPVVEGDQANQVDAEGDAGKSPSGWIAGKELEKVQEGEGWEDAYDLRWPFAYTKGGEDWEGREFILTQVYNLLGTQISTNTYPLLLVPPPSPPSLPLPTQALYTQLSFETLNVPALSILPTPIAALFALGATSGIILHIGRTTSEVSIITDSILRWECNTTVEVGLEDCEKWFEGLLLQDQALEAELRKAAGLEAEWNEATKAKLVKEVAKVVWTECTGDDIEVPAATAGSKGAIIAATSQAQETETDFDVAKKLVGDVAPAAPSHKKKLPPHKQEKAAAVAAAAAAVEAASDVISISLPSLPEKEISLGPVRHRLCEPLLRGKAPGGDTVWEGIGRALEGASLSVGEKMMVWDGVGVIGELARIKTFAPALTTYLSPYLLSSPDLPSDTQPAKLRLLSIPDYFANFKGSSSELAPFLGASMVARMAFSDNVGRHSITKVDYNARGPAAIYAIATSGTSGEDA